jgi:hypothetical protein
MKEIVNIQPIEKRNEIEGFPDFKSCYKSTVTKTVWCYYKGIQIE